jgi:hypothetical protein
MNETGMNENGKKRVDPGSEGEEMRGGFPLNSGPWRPLPGWRVLVVENFRRLDS